MSGGIVSPVFVGRDQELATLDAAMAVASGGDPVFALIGGEAGIGKTRLAEEFTTRATTAGFAVLNGKQVKVNWIAGSGQSVFENLGANGAFVDKNFAKDHKLAVGSPIKTLVPSGETQTFKVLGIFKPPPGGSPFGPVTIASAEFDRLYTQPQDLFIFIDTTNGVTKQNTAALKTSLKGFPNAKVQTISQFKTNQAGGLDSILNVLYVLLALSVIVSLFGIVNTLVLTVFERTREIGMLRAVGMTRRQVRRMIRYESIITALLGAALGIPLGVVLALLVGVAIKYAAFTVPVGTLVVFVFVAILVGLVAAIFPARRASRLNVLEALQYE